MRPVQVLCIGNAIVDILARVEDQFLTDHGRTKGAMMLVDMETSARLYDAMPPATERSGGCAANTAAGIASFGGTTRFVGKVRDDQLGTVFRHDIRAGGVHFDTEPSTDGEATATSMILVTPDAQRTMNTYLGACGHLTPDDIRREDIETASALYVEGYLWDRPAAKDAVRKAMTLAKECGTDVALTLSDSFCVDRFRDEFLDLVENHVDVLFANEDEIKSLYQVDSFEAAVEKLRPSVKIAALTRGAEGSVALTANEMVTVRAFDTEVEDTTGAGDLYASGFLYGLTSGQDLKTCAHLGALAASEIISHLGARPNVSLKAEAEKQGLL